MRTVTLKALVLACGAVAAVLGTPRESQAIFGWLNGCCKKQTTYNYNPCNPCGQQTVNYVPQTCYRTQYVCVPVTSYRPVTSCDPCTGCPVTCMRPVVNYVQQARQIPYTSFRLVYSNPCATPAYGAAGYGGVSAAGYSHGVTPACSQCNTSAAYAAPASQVPYYTPPAAGAATIAPSLPSSSSVGPEASGSSAPSTFESRMPAAEDHLKPIPDPQVDEESRSEAPSTPQLIDPDNQTTRFPIPRARGIRAVSRPERSTVSPIADYRERPAARPTANDGGWRPSTR